MATMFSKMYLVKALAIAAVAAIGAQATPAVASGELTVREASPAPVDAEDLVARADGNLFVCVNANFAGPCQNLSFNVGQCNNLGAPFQDSISSAGPDGGFRCVLWRDINCTGTSVTITSPGINNFATTGLNDQVSSYRCSRI